MQGIYGRGERGALETTSCKDEGSQRGNPGCNVVTAEPVVDPARTSGAVKGLQRYPRSRQRDRPLCPQHWAAPEEGTQPQIR